MGTFLHDIPREKGLKNKRKPGLARKYRRMRYSEWMNVGVTEDVIKNSPSAPDHVLSAMKEVFGDRAEKLVLAIHPLFKRWALWEKCNYKGQRYYSPVSVFHTGARPGYMPVDLQGRGLDHLTGVIGDHRMPHKEDFVIIEKFDVKKYGPDAINEMLDKQEQDALESAQKDFDNDTYAFFLDNFWLAMRDEQDHYSKPWSTRSVDVKENPKKWKITQKKGYKIRERVYGEEGNKSGMDAIAEGNTKGLEYAHADELLEETNRSLSGTGSKAKADRVSRRRNKDSDLLRRNAKVEQKQPQEG